MIASKGSQPKLSASGAWKADRADHPGLMAIHTMTWTLVQFSAALSKASTTKGKNTGCAREETGSG